MYPSSVSLSVSLLTSALLFVPCFSLELTVSIWAGIPGFDDADLPRLVGIVFGSLLLINHVVSIESMTSAQLVHVHFHSICNQSFCNLNSLLMVESLQLTEIGGAGVVFSGSSNQSTFNWSSPQSTNCYPSFLSMFHL